MATLATILSVIGAIISIIFTIVIIIQAFKTSIVWGIVCLLISPAILVYTFTHWDEAKSPFLKVLLGVVIMIVGALVGTMA